MVLRPWSIGLIMGQPKIMVSEEHVITMSYTICIKTVRYLKKSAPIVSQASRMKDSTVVSE